MISFYENHAGDHTGYRVLLKCLARLEVMVCAIVLQRIHVKEIGQ